jgi:hypothetical protein
MGGCQSGVITPENYIEILKELIMKDVAIV